jgi:hypothetical protein
MAGERVGLVICMLVMRGDMTGEHTAMLLRHIEQSCEYDELDSPFAPAAIFLSLLCVAMLVRRSAICFVHRTIRVINLLECVEFVLPATIELQPHFDATEDHLLATLKVNAELNNVAIVHREWLGLGPWRTETDVVKEGARAALDVLDVPPAVLEPELAVPSADDLALEAHRGRRWCIWWDILLVIPLGVTANTDDLLAGWKSARDGGKLERRPGGTRIVEGAEPNRRQVLHVWGAAGGSVARAGASAGHVGVGRR